jgi:hypothetical protein
MAPKQTLVLKYTDNMPGKCSFAFYPGKKNGDDYHSGLKLPFGIYIKGPIGKHERFVIFKNVMGEEEMFEIEDKKEEAIKLAYTEALGLRDIILKSHTFLLEPGICIDKTGLRFPPSKLEKEIEPDFSA